MAENVFVRDAPKRVSSRSFLYWLASVILTPAALTILLYVSLLAKLENPPWGWITVGRLIGLDVAFLAFSLPILPLPPGTQKRLILAYRGMSLLLLIPAIGISLFSGSSEVISRMTGMVAAAVLGVAIAQWLVIRSGDHPLPKWLLWAEGIRIVLLGNLLLLASLFYCLLPVLEVTVFGR